jgi:hypothetical protein
MLIFFRQPWPLAAAAGVRQCSNAAKEGDDSQRQVPSPRCVSLVTCLKSYNGAIARVIPYPVVDNYFDSYMQSLSFEYGALGKNERDLRHEKCPGFF